MIEEWFATSYLSEPSGTAESKPGSRQNSVHSFSDSSAELGSDPLRPIRCNSDPDEKNWLLGMRESQYSFLGCSGKQEPLSERSSCSAPLACLHPPPRNLPLPANRRSSISTEIVASTSPAWSPGKLAASLQPDNFISGTYIGGLRIRRPQRDAGSPGRNLSTAFSNSCSHWPSRHSSVGYPEVPRTGLRPS